MTSSNNFNAIFKNDELAKEFSQLLEQASGTKKSSKKDYRYTKEELLQIRDYPLSKIPKSVFFARLKQNLSDSIIHSLQRKKPEERIYEAQNSFECNELGDDNGQNYSYYKNNGRQYKQRDNGHEVCKDNLAVRFEKNYRSSKVESESAPCWRTDRNMANRSRYQDRYSESTRKSDRYNSRPSYGRNSNGYRGSEHEEEPEWFSNGPESMTDFIDLKGFDDDIAYEEEDEQTENLSMSTNHNTFESSRTSMNRNLDDSNSMINMNVSNLLNSSNASLFEKDITDFPLSLFGDLNCSNTSSRAEKWFKRDSVANIDDQFNVSSPLTVSSDKSNSVMDLFQNVDLKKFPQSPHVAPLVANMKVDLSKATSVAELEASFLNSEKKHNIDKANDNKEPAALSKLFSLAAQHEAKCESPAVPISSFLPNESSSFIQTNNQTDHETEVQTNTQRYRAILPEMLLVDNNANRVHHSAIFKAPHGQYPPFEGLLPPPPGLVHNFEGGMPLRPPFASLQFKSAEFAHRFFPPGSLVHPGYMPHNLPFPAQPMGQCPMESAPNFPNHFMTQYGPTIQQHQPPRTATMHEMMPNMRTTVDPNFPGNKNNVSDKLLKNSKFTPTSVLRKLKDHDPSKSKPVKLEISDVKEAPPGFPRQQSTSPIPGNFNDSGPKNINVEGHDFLMRLQQHLNLGNKSQSDINQVNPSDIFSSVIKKSDHNTNLPPLPLKNALKLEDLEKL